MDNNVIIGVAVAVVVIGLAWWFFGSSSDSNTQKSKEDITKLLEGQGYRIKEVEFDDGAYEVEAYKDGKEFEIKLDRMGNILKIEEDD
jgi:uncharacterized membrane protein YkoI